ncbi:hypothetical protein MNV49_004903 [Pseudohyphozyma bogoriensis]|nr:hypothetical protein MNV49_004903 [Pseudohyphozyma bogoriensis]
MSTSPSAVVDWKNVAISFGLLGVTIAVSVVLNLGIASSLLVAACRCVVQLSLMGLLLTVVFNADSPWAVLGMSLGMILLGANEVTFTRSKRRPSGLWVNSFTSLICSVLPVCTFGARFAIVNTPFWSPASFIPILGMITGNAISGMAVANNMVLKQLVDARDQVETYLAHGGTRFEVCLPVAREALRVALLPTINQMSVVGLMMTGAILGGESTDRAAKMQMPSVSPQSLTRTIGSGRTEYTAAMEDHWISWDIG